MPRKPQVNFRLKPEGKDGFSNIVLDFAESQLHKQILDGSTTATIFLLKTKGKSRGYIERQEIVTDADNFFKVEILDDEHKD